jgi:hypothetical protein
MHAALGVETLLQTGSGWWADYQFHRKDAKDAKNALCVLGALGVFAGLFVRLPS